MIKAAHPAAAVLALAAAINGSGPGDGSGWSIRHDENLEGTYDTKEAAFESAVAAALLAIRQGHDVRNEAGNETALGLAVT